MNDNIINENKNNLITLQNNAYCINCGDRGHLFKNCPKSIISSGIISIYIDDFDMKDASKLETIISNEINNYKLTVPKKYQISNYDNYENNDKIDNINDKIKFLMIQRKNSLGYLELMRGKYNVNDTKSINNLLEQLTNDEISIINDNNFDVLWNNLWDFNTDNHSKEYHVSKQKFEKLKRDYNHLINNNKPIFNFKEWGFPKGRRNQYETNEICAIREFEEETGLQDNNYTILDKCNFITENLIGTNGVNYSHNYYISILHKGYDKNIKIDNKEVGDLKLYNINECLNAIRPYHINKRIIVEYIYNSIVKFYND